MDVWDVWDTYTVVHQREAFTYFHFLTKVDDVVLKKSLFWLPKKGCAILVKIVPKVGHAIFDRKIGSTLNKKCRHCKKVCFPGRQKINRENLNYPRFVRLLCGTVVLQMFRSRLHEVNQFGRLVMVVLFFLFPSRITGNSVRLKQLGRARRTLPLKLTPWLVFCSHCLSDCSTWFIGTAILAHTRLLIGRTICSKVSTE